MNKNSDLMSQNFDQFGYTSSKTNPLHPNYNKDQPDIANSTPSPDANSILTSAAQIVSGVRNNQHGHKERSFETIAKYWTIYLNSTQGDAVRPIKPVDVAQMMVLLKMARSAHGEALLDHFVDQAGYSGIAGELAKVKK